MLYLVSTPIGNLNDISYRAIETLRNVDIIASEDTRKTGILLKHFDIKTKQISFHDHNENKAGRRIRALIEQGKSVALVTDAGTPSICDPGFTLVRLAINLDSPVTVVPGASAFVAALILSGLPVHSFTFRGFPPRKPGPRRRFLEMDKDSPHTLIFYESPHRLKDLLECAAEVLGDRPSALANDLTKVFESVKRGTLIELLQFVKEQELKGEYTIVIAGKQRRAKAQSGYCCEMRDEC
ncbi:MAG: 16S rRNA (cytidine(1402)-2'-O)-methyltransferase [Acidobacteria bacterium]|nr:16S rRNA (cytidine(1402)-2'-O)-methyltransferase [Acidobacteriota bacterium]